MIEDGGVNTEPKPGRWCSGPLMLSFATLARPAKDSLMRLLHAALTCSAEEGADAFYADLLDMKKGSPKTLYAALSSTLLSVDATLRIIYYTGDSLEMEVFIIDSGAGRPAGIDHLCLVVENLAAFLEKCRLRNIRILQVPKGNRLITFISDADGNRFEIKGA